MTIKEFYEWAIENHYEDATLTIYGGEGGKLPVEICYIQYNKKNNTICIA